MERLEGGVAAAKNAFALAGRWEGIDAFRGFGEGLEWIDSEDRREDLRDAVRYWAEDCDTLGGFRILCDDSAAGGVCARASRTFVATKRTNREPFSVRPPAVREKKRMDMLNAAFASTTLAELSDLYCPLAASRDYPTMAELAAGSGWFRQVGRALNGRDPTPWRLKSKGSNEASSMREMARFMTNRAGPHALGANICALASVQQRRKTPALTKAACGLGDAGDAKRQDDDDDDSVPFARWLSLARFPTIPSSSNSVSAASSPKSSTVSRRRCARRRR